MEMDLVVVFPGLYCGLPLGQADDDEGSFLRPHRVSCRPYHGSCLDSRRRHEPTRTHPVAAGGPGILEKPKGLMGMWRTAARPQPAEAAEASRCVVRSSTSFDTFLRLRKGPARSDREIAPIRSPNSTTDPQYYTNQSIDYLPRSTKCALRLV